MRNVYICSPFSPQGNTPEEKNADLKRNIDLVKKVCRDAVKKGYTPYAPHLYFTQFLSDSDAVERVLGMCHGLLWLNDCDELWVVGDRVTKGMQTEIEEAKSQGIPVKHLKEAGFVSGEYHEVNHGINGIIDIALEDNIFIDTEAEILYSSDQQCFKYPSRFATVGFELVSTYFLEQLADHIRDEQHLKVFGKRADPGAWYSFSISLNDFTKSKLDTCITFIVRDDNALDNEEMYYIDLSEAEQKAIYRCLDKQCREKLGKSCEDLLAEARREMYRS